MCRRHFSYANHHSILTFMRRVLTIVNVAGLLRVGMLILPSIPDSSFLCAGRITNLNLYAYDAETGKELFSSKDTIPGWVHFSDPVVANDRVYVSTWEGTVYSFWVEEIIGLTL
jgi:outer membrane protein assembly factor BamB